MLMIAGSIRQSVQMATMNALIEEKKTKGFVEKQRQMSPQERMLEQFKEQAAQEKEAEYTNGIANKVMSGKTLSSEEIEYLQQKNPALLQEYREMQEEKKSYERQLRQCKTKEEVERVRVNKINGYLAQAKSISHNAVIPKGEKKAMLEKIMARLTNMEKVYVKFVKSEQYRKMPREQEIAKERAELSSEREEAVTELLQGAAEKQEEVAEEPQGAAEKQEEVAEEPQGAAEKQEEVAEEPQGAAEKQEEVAEEPQGAAEKQGENAEKSREIAEEPQGAAEKQIVPAEEGTVVGVNQEKMTEDGEKVLKSEELNVGKEELSQQKERNVEGTGPTSSPGDNLAKKAVTLIQNALSTLNKYSYNSSGSTVSMELDRDTGKRIDVKK